MTGKYDQHLCHADKIATIPNLKRGESHPDFSEVQNYLKRYGYLKPDEPCAEGQLCKDTVRVLTNFQKFFNVEPSGEFDEPTRDEMAAPRCGLPDFSELEARTIGPWDDGNLRYAFGNSTEQDVGPEATENAVRSAFATWSASSDAVNFTEVGAKEDPDILVEWRPAADPDHSMVGGVLAHADFPPGFSIITQGRPLPLHFDDKEHLWDTGAQPNAFDIETVALHEIGHCLGILHTNVPGSVMFPSVRRNFTLRDPQPDDLVALRRLYEGGGG